MPIRDRKDDLLTVLSIGRDASMRGEGISLWDALSRSGYADIRPEINADDLIAELKSNADLVADWVMYSEDKRTDGGWYILSEKREIGRLGENPIAVTFDTLEEAVAYYVLHELDFWAKLNAS